MKAIPFPPRDAGPVLARAMEAAEAAGGDAVREWASHPWDPWGAADTRPDLVIQHRAMIAATPILRLLTADEAMVDILASGLATEVMVRLRKRGAA